MPVDRQEMADRFPRPSTRAIQDALHRFIYVVTWKDSLHLLRAEQSLLLSDSCLAALRARIAVMTAHSDSVLPSAALMKTHLAVLERARKLGHVSPEYWRELLGDISLMGLKRPYESLERQIEVEDAKALWDGQPLGRKLPVLESQQALLLSETAIAMWHCSLAQFRALGDLLAVRVEERSLRVMEDARKHGIAAAYNSYMVRVQKDADAAMSAAVTLLNARSESEAQRILDKRQDVLVDTIGYEAMYLLASRARDAGDIEVADRADRYLRLLMDIYTHGIMAAWQAFKSAQY